jgi:hypothetical protein
MKKSIFVIGIVIGLLGAGFYSFFDLPKEKAQDEKQNKDVNYTISANIDQVTKEQSEQQETSTKANNNSQEIRLLKDKKEPPPVEIVRKKRQEVWDSIKGDCDQAIKLIRNADYAYEKLATETDRYNRQLKDPKNYEWDCITKGECTDDSGNRLKGEGLEPVLIKNVKQAYAMIQHPNFRADLDKYLKLASDGLSERDVYKLVKAHSIIHDLHNWVIGFEIPQEPYVSTWEAHRVYLGTTKTLQK